MPALKTTEKIYECERCPTNGLYPLAQPSSDARRLLGNGQTKHDYRTDYTRDRDRILYSEAFKRLIHKTQVYTSADPSKFTTRLTHTLKVSQIAQTISRALKLNEDLTVAIALGHDIGHPPFGHLGEDNLRNLMIELGGFEHNEESVWILMRFEGLNLTYQTLEGILKHTSFDFTPYDAKGMTRSDPFDEFNLQGAPRTFKNCFKYGCEKGTNGKLKFEMPATLEGQVVDIADEIAYVTHDLVDLRNAGTIDAADIPDWWIKRFGTMKQERNAIDTMVTGVIDSVSQQISVMTKPENVTIVHPVELSQRVTDIKQWFGRIFDTKFANTKKEVEAKIEKLFEYFSDNEEVMTELCPYYERIKGYAYKGKQLVGHCIATMTDREVDKAYKRITG